MVARIADMPLVTVRFALGTGTHTPLLTNLMWVCRDLHRNTMVGETERRPMDLGALWYFILLYGLPIVLVGAIIAAIAVLLGYIYAWLVSRGR